VRFQKAEEHELDAVRLLYKSAIGTDGCTWNEQYPGESELRDDFAAGCLFVLTASNTVLGAVSVVPENELDDQGIWTVNDGTQREIARLAVAPACRGRGCARHMLTQLFEQLKAAGCHSVHILVAKINTPAIRLYRSMGFSFLGECFLYGHHFFACEKILQTHPGEVLP
jgi:ribosomal protein S18 acetylase RimI-like enzyme